MFRLKIKRYEEQFKILVISALLFVSCFLTYYFLRILNITIVFSHFFYVPIFLACFWWKKKGLIVPIILAGLLIFLTLFSGLDDINIDYLLRGFMFVIIGTIVSILSNQVSKAEEILKESEEKHRLISENANDLILILNRKLRFEFVNKDPLFKMLGYLIDDVIGKRPIEFVHSNDFNEVLEAMQKGFKTGRIFIQARIKHKNGSHIWAEISGSIFTDKNEDKKFLIFLRDFTKRKKIEQKLKESEEKLRKLNKELEQRIEERTKKLKESEERYRDFTSIASHEFKTPLIPIIGIPQLLVMDNNLTEQQKDYLNEILHNGKKLNNLINNLLDISQIERKSVKLSKREIEINPLIDWCISDLSFLIKQKNHTLTKNLQEDIKLNIDDKKISRVLTNLIFNAIKYTPSNGKIEISTQIDEENNFIFSIKDNGIGIEEKDQELIFQKFGKIRGEEIVKYELDSHGSGLGLFISKEIIKLHGGEMWFESAGKNNGTTFYFKLPRK